MREAELYRRKLHLWQEIIETVEELHMVTIDPAMQKTLREASVTGREIQKKILAYLKCSDEMFEKLDTALGEFPGGVSG